MKNASNNTFPALFCGMILVLFSACSENDEVLESKKDHEYETLKMSILKHQKSLASSEEELRKIEFALEELLLSSGEGAIEEHQSRQERVQAIQENIKAQKLQLAELRKKNNKQNQQQAQLQFQHAKLIENIGDQEEEILVLINELDQYDLRHQQLEEDLHALRMEREKLEDALYSAAIFIGNREELLNEGLAEMKGGFLGFGKKTVLKDDFNTAAFHPIDARLTSVFHLEGKEVKVLSSHPSEAYRIEKISDQQQFTILDPDAFWSRSKHLTVLVQ